LNRIRLSLPNISRTFLIILNSPRCIIQVTFIHLSLRQLAHIAFSLINFSLRNLTHIAFSFVNLGLRHMVHIALPINSSRLIQNIPGVSIVLWGRTYITSSNFLNFGRFIVIS